MDEAFHSLIENIRGDEEQLQDKQTKLNEHWQELQTLVSDRFDELVLTESELEKIDMNDSLEKLTKSLAAARELDRIPVPKMGSSSIDEIKGLVGKCQVSVAVTLFRIGRKNLFHNDIIGKDYLPVA